MGGVAWLSPMAGSDETATTSSPANPLASFLWSRSANAETVAAGDVLYRMNSVTAGGPGLVAVGWVFSGGEMDAAVWTSSEGIAWSLVPDDDAMLADGQMLSVTVGGPGLVAVGLALTAECCPGSAAAVWTSPDGVTWSRVPHDEAVLGGAGRPRMNSVAAGGPGLVAVGSAGFAPGGLDGGVLQVAAVWTSPDGVSWSRELGDNAPFRGGEMFGVTAGGPGLVAVGTVRGVAAVWTSLDESTWSRVPHSTAVFGRGEMFSVTVGGPGLVAVGQDNDDAAVWTSPDGITWSRAPHDEAVFGGQRFQGMNSVIAAGPGLVAAGSGDSADDTDAALWASEDGITWFRVPRDEAVFGGQGWQQMLSLTAGGPGLVAVGFDSQGPRDDIPWDPWDGTRDMDGVVWLAKSGD